MGDKLEKIINHHGARRFKVWVPHPMLRSYSFMLKRELRVPLSFFTAFLLSQNFIIVVHIQGWGNHMPRKPFKNSIREFVESQYKEKGWREKTKRDYKNALMKVRRENPDLQGRKPSCFSQEEILKVTRYWEDLKPRGKRHYWCIWRQFLEWAKNLDIHQVNYKIPKEHNRIVYWLDEEESAKCREAAESLGLAHLVNFHLGRDLGLRRCGKIRLKWQNIDFQREQIEVLGKGMKWRTIPFHPLSEDILSRWKESRKDMVQKAREHNKKKGYERKVEDPPEVLAWRKWGKMGNYSDSTADNRLNEIEERAGIAINGHHTLRRTFARSLYNNGIELKTIRDLLGHNTIEQTLKYIGIQQSEMKNSLQKSWEKNRG